MNRMCNSQQIANIAETNYRTERMANKKDVATTHYYGYDANGNQLFVNTGTLNAQGQLQVTDTRRMLWDEDNHLLAVSDNGFVSNYWYDAAGERTVKETGDGEGVNINGAVSAGRTGTSNFTVYVNPYTVINNGGQMSKHIYVGGERILSKLCDAGSMADPTKDTTACAKNFTAKYADLTSRVKTRFDSLGVAYFGKDNRSSNTYYKAASGSITPSLYYFHSDHLGSASLITDGAGHLNQNLAYIPNGEVFVNQQLTSFDSRYKFSGKEMDAETGLYYCSQRYFDPKNPGFISSDPLRELKPWIGSYVYCSGNPVNMIDPDGLDDEYFKSNGSHEKTVKSETNNIYIAHYNNKGYTNIKDYVFNKTNVVVLVRILRFFAHQAGLDLSMLKNHNFSVAQENPKYNESGQSTGEYTEVVLYNSGTTTGDDVMNTDVGNKTITATLDADGLLSCYLTTSSDIISTIKHEFDHLDDTELASIEHLAIYYKQITDPGFKKTSVDYKNHIINNARNNLHFVENNGTPEVKAYVKEWIRKYKKVGIR